MSVFNVPSGGNEHVLHSSIVPKLDLDTWFRSVDLHHRYFVVRKRYLSINPFMTLICQNACTSNAHRIAFCDSHILSVGPQAHKQDKEKEIT